MLRIVLSLEIIVKLYVLLFGRTKAGKKSPIMIDSLEKCEKYKKAREATKGSKAGNGFHEITPAPAGSKVWKKKTATVGGNKYQTHKNNGYISKDGFNPHT